jgi:hypothetical protein
MLSPPSSTGKCNIHCDPSEQAVQEGCGCFLGTCHIFHNAALKSPGDAYAPAILESTCLVVPGTASNSSCACAFVLRLATQRTLHHNMGIWGTVCIMQQLFRSAYWISVTLKFWIFVGHLLCFCMSHLLPGISGCHSPLPVGQRWEEEAATSNCSPIAVITVYAGWHYFFLSTQVPGWHFAHILNSYAAAVPFCRCLSYIIVQPDTSTYFCLLTSVLQYGMRISKDVASGALLPFPPPAFVIFVSS